MRTYLIPLLFVALWWWLAFRDEWQLLEPEEPVVVEHVSRGWQMLPTERTELKQALTGDDQLKAQLMLRWDTEAELLEADGVESIQRLPHESLVIAQRTARQTPPEGVDGFLLPQSYAAASMLLALADDEQIFALPEHYRENCDRLAPERAASIPRDLNAYSLEELSTAPITCAFVAEYSHPSIVETLRAQRIRVVPLVQQNSLEGVCQDIHTVAKELGAPKRGELLTLFMKASLMHLQNRLRAAGLSRECAVLYAQRFSDYSVPCKYTLLYDLLEHLGLTALMEQLPLTESGLWNAPIDWEQMQQADPEIILLSCGQRNGRGRTELMRQPALADCAAIKSGRVYELDSTLQQSPSPYAVLAAYDIVEELLRAPS